MRIQDLLVSSALAAAALAAAPAVAETFFLDTNSLTAGSACNATDQSYWASEGFSKFDEAIQRCTQGHFDDGSGLGSGANSKVVENVARCMQDVAPQNEEGGEKLYVGSQGYTPDCSSCMGVLAECSIEKCTFGCAALGGSGSNSCRDCVNKECVAAFYECGGLDPTCNPADAPCENSEVPTVLILASVGGLAALLIAIGVVYKVRQHNKRMAATREEFSRQLQVAAAKAPKVGPQPTLLPDSPGVAAAKSKVLLVKFAFQAEADNELTVRENEQLTGIQEVDSEWWMARNKKGKVGLVPAAYVEVYDSEDEITPEF